MYVADRLIYLELQKTGSKQIRRLLSSCIGGKQTGKHNRMTELQPGRMIVDSIRNPWAWYVSLWAFGCLGRGTGSWKMPRFGMVSIRLGTTASSPGGKRRDTSYAVAKK